MSPTHAESRPVKVFSSYSHKDEALRGRLGAHLAALVRQGLIEDWHDRRIDAGTEWERRIHARLESSRIILLLISSDFFASRYCYDLEMTRALRRHEAGEARVIPVILRPSDWQSSPFGKLQALPGNGKPVTSWRNRDAAFEDVTRGIRGVAEELRRASPPSDAPRPASSPRQPAVAVSLETGAMPVDSPFYVCRSADHLAERRLESSDSTVIVRGSRQSGKSSLLTRLHFRAVEAGRRSCYLNLQDVDDSSLGDSGTLFRELARMIADALETATDPDEHWSDRRGSKQNLTTFLQEAVLAPGGSAVQLLFDEVDLAFGFAQCRVDLFSMIRSWHNRRASDHKGRWRRLRLVVAHATDPALWIPDINQSPFNVGLNVALDDFGAEHVADLNLRHGAPLNGDEEVRRLLDLVGGHPFLVRLALYTLVSKKWALEELERTATDQGGPFASHLQRYYSLVSKGPELRAALRQVVEQGRCDDELQFQHLWAAGLVRGETREAVTLRCRLYHDYFRTRL
jgi:hypothetical protein